MSTVDLPFGRTRVSVAELRAGIDVETASEELLSADVSNPEEAIESFIEYLPSLLVWLEEHGREYPWRSTTDPWRIYATEILLQRTRSDAVDEIYADFFTRYPDPGALLIADEDSLRDTVRPLGFVNHRERTLREAAELCVEEHNGDVPEDIDALQRPWRVGPYTARASLIFAFGKPLAIVDTNTARITGRVFDYPLPSQPHKSSSFYRLLDALVPADPSLARAFNLALLDLGALICTGGNPDCNNCPLAPACTYAAANRD
ncbi:hypothetical protein [Halovivax limisalsi]|uniref:hypothetical protein n=1 Tax=Halovivax limisalsi TaxID=1453760 RepID=UPI001FFD49AD|nr:hypothetical protein [Halovivax limisalsi]